MPIVVTQSGSSAAPVPSSSATTLVSDITALVQEDLYDTFASSGNTSVLIEYVNRIQQMLLGMRPGSGNLGWSWMLSSPQKFITEVGRTDYWIGATSGQAAGQVDTGLNLTDVRRVRQGHLFSRSGYKELFNADEAPLMTGWMNKDSTYNQGPPKVFRSDDETPNVMSLYPAPNEGNAYEIIPYPPIVTTGTGGALAARTYFIKISFVDEEGNEGFASEPAVRQFINASKLITVKAPVAPILAGTSGVRYNQYNIYASTTEGSETLQNVSPTAIASDWTEAASGLTTTGASVPTSSDIEPLRGYIVEFRYYKRHSILSASGDSVLIPDDYRDVVIAGVNWLGCEYLKNYAAANRWRAIFDEGRMRMNKDQNYSRGFIMPDAQTQNYRQILPTGGFTQGL